MTNDEILRAMHLALGTDVPPDHTPSSDADLLAFLDGLILERRGPRPASAATPTAPPALVTNNAVLKKLRIALAFKEDQVAAAFAAGGLPLGHYELGALFRQEGQRHFRACTDEQLLAFLRGLSAAASPGPSAAGESG